MLNLFSQEIAKNKNPCELQTSHTPGKLTEARSVFEDATEQNKIDNKKEKFFAPPKPPRLGTTEANPVESQPADKQPATKRKAPSPPNTKNGSSEAKAMDDKTASVIKRKAPEPPCQDKNEINSDSSNGMECEQLDNKVRKPSPPQSLSTDQESDGVTAPVPAKRERKGSIDSLDGNNKSDQPTPKPRRVIQNSSEGKNVSQEENISGSVKKPKKAVADTTVTIVATPIDDKETFKAHTSKQRLQQEPCIIQACMVEESTPEVPIKSTLSNANIVTVKALSCDDADVKSKAHRSERVRVTSVDENASRKSTRNEKITGVSIEAVSTERKPSKSSRKTRQSTKKEEFGFKVPKRPAPARDNCHVDLNETVNLNDVNIHEITFNFDFGQFDQQLEKEKESMFVSYEEKCKQVRCSFALILCCANSGPIKLCHLLFHSLRPGGRQPRWEKSKTSIL